MIVTRLSGFCVTSRCDILVVIEPLSRIAWEISVDNFAGTTLA
jgi:hypothetical protein